MDEYRAAQCVGKVAFASAVLARRVLKRPSRVRNGRANAYKCSYCGMWHIGEPSKKGRAQRYEKDRE